MKTKIVLINVFTAFLILFFLTCLKIYFNGKEELSTAEELLKNKNYAQAVVHFERAIQWYFPISNTASLAAGKLWDITLHYENENLQEEALKTCRLLRGAFYSTRSFYTPGKKWINLCNGKIVHLMASKSAGDNKTSLIFENQKKKFLKNMEADRPPSTFWSILIEVGFFGWVTCVILFLLKAVTPTANLKPKPAVAYITAFLIFYSIWVMGMFNV